jgi:uncharacterized membrane protein
VTRSCVFASAWDAIGTALFACAMGLVVWFVWMLYGMTKHPFLLACSYLTTALVTLLIIGVIRKIVKIHKANRYYDPSRWVHR